MVPVVSIVGKSKSGKTTLVCKIISELKDRGYKVATIKHDTHGFDIDKPGKDTWKHGEAGSSTVVISSPSKIAMIQQLEEEKKLDEIIEKIENADIILTEGYKRENKPKIEVVRSERSNETLCDESEAIAIATDIEDFSFGDVPVFDWNDSKGIANLLVDKYL
ncbi:molybdopterin-guanine dinucleotide biosynthesis protein B [Natranaerofaba carboxydovora]|uniref:molybdopterin-guanine dinucleotide biosynthesis protein B n=1 Tax=Natranaerofaba carboxydovora TaxID=2742683 RepID=UPI001F12BAEA|nr:molybdopterin-guanine dinucleotide biosynthesis protein B [Natranaerofaba carboxydovora]UMZ73199.1 Molybdopterin-guanine dinucleotide biosynthesis adapter protein [Natranaerofaba carboxydovora]